MEQKFKIDDIVKYNGNIYQIVGLRMEKQSLIYDVKCLKNNFPDEPVSSSIGSCAEDKMELVDFNEPTEKQQWIEKACDWPEKQGSVPNPYISMSFDYNGHTWGMCARDGGVDILRDKQLIGHLEKQGEHNPIKCNKEWYDFVRWFVKERTDNYTLIPSETDIYTWGDIILGHAKKELEKQGENKPTDKVEPKFKVGDKIKLAEEPKYPARKIIAIKNDAYYFDRLVHLPFSHQDEWELVGQKPAWSEKDEKIYSRIYDLIHAAAFTNCSVDEDGNELGEYAKITNWLKALKDRVQPQTTWKPSDEQMENLSRAVNGGSYRTSLLMELYQDLKKLKG